MADFILRRSSTYKIQLVSMDLPNVDVNNFPRNMVKDNRRFLFFSF